MSTLRISRLDISSKSGITFKVQIECNMLIKDKKIVKRFHLTPEDFGKALLGLEVPCEVAPKDFKTKHKSTLPKKGKKKK